MRVLLFASLAFATAVPAMALEMCFVPSSNGLDETLDCDPIAPAAHPNGWIGYAEQGAPCSFGSCGSGGASPDYQWTMSSSATDPYENVGDLAGPMVDIHLWLSCNQEGLPGAGGASAAEFGVGVLGGEVLEFTPLAGISNAGTATDLQLAVFGCPQGPLRIGTWTVLVDPSSVEGTDWSRVKASHR